MPVQFSDPRAGLIEATTVGDCVERAAQTWSHDCMVFPGERATFPEFAGSDHFARVFLGLGIASGETIGIRMEQTIDYYAVLVGAAKIGAIGVPINVRFKAYELAHVIGNSEMTLLVGSPDGGEVGDHVGLLLETLPELGDAHDPELSMPSAPRLRRIVVNGPSTERWMLGSAELDAAAALVTDEQLDARRLGVRIRDTAVLMYTSGTTANPKGARLSHEALVREGVVVGRTRFSLTSDDVMWTPLPLYHIGGIAFAFACLSFGVTYCHTGRFDPGVGARQLRDERCTIAIPAFEMLWMAVIDHPDFDVNDVPALRIVFNVGVPERLRQLQERVPNVVQVSGFGSTEACSFFTLGEVDDSLEDRVMTTGRPLPGLQVKIVDFDTGLECEPGAVGELLYKGWSVFDGYYNDPDRNAEVFDDDGYFHSGDLGSLDENGRLRYAGRLKDMMKVGGENVAAVEVEGFLLRHEAVAVVQVVSAPDARYTEVPAAFVQLAPGAEATEQDIVDFCLGQIATFKVPRYVRFVTEWPMSGTKVKKYLLRDQITAELEAAGITEAPKLSTVGVTPPDVVVVGAGPAGLTAGALLTHHGHRVHVYESNVWLGGFSGTFEVDGFTLNLGAHLLEDPGSGITAIFDHLGLDLVHGPVSSELPVWDPGRNAWGSIRDRYATSRPALKKVIKAIVDSPWEAFDEWDDRPLRGWLAQHTDDDGVIALFEYIAFLEFLTIDWWEHSASDSLYLRKMHFGERGTAGYSSWPVGGWGRLWTDLTAVIRGGGGEVHTSVRTRVVTDSGRVVGVETWPVGSAVPNEIPRRERTDVDAVIVAVPAWEVVSVVGSGTLPDWYEGQIGILADPAYRDAWVNVAFATQEPVPVLDRLELATWTSSASLDRPGFVFEQSAYDPTSAPAGSHLYVAGVAIPGPLGADEDAVSTIADALERDVVEMVPGLATAVWTKRQAVFDPSIGVASKPMLVGRYRPHWRAPNIDGLWLAHETLRSRGIEDDRVARAALTVVEDLVGHRLRGLDATWRY